MKTHFQVLDGLRGTAALTVVLFHIFEWLTPDWAHNPLHHAYLAVDFFFALSGFVVGYAYDERLARGAEPKLALSFWEFIKRRLIRLHPLVPVAALFGLLGFIFDPNVGMAQTVGIAISPGKLMLIFTLSLFLLPTPNLPNTYGETHSINGPSWTLFLEYVANLLYGLFAHRLKRRLHIVLCVVSAAALIPVALHFNLLGFGWSWDTYWVAPIRLAYPFLAGLLVYRLKLKLHVPQPYLLSSLLLVGMFSVPFLGRYTGLYEAGCVILVFPLILMMGAGVDKVEGRIGTFCRFTGELSYPLYILHYPFIYLYAHWLLSTHPHGALRIGVSAAVYLGVIGIATILLYFYDKPVRAWLAKRYLRP